MNRFVTSRTEQEVFSDLESLCASPGYIHVLAYVSLRDNFIFFGDRLTADDTAASYDPERTIRTEFSTLVGLMLKHPIVFDLPLPKDLQELIDRTRSLLDELHACLNRPMFQGIRVRRAEDADSFFGSGEVLREPIFYGGESAYNFQYRDFLLERYAKDDDWLHTNKGFRIAEAHAVAVALARIQSRKVMNTIERLRGLPPSQWTILPGFGLVVQAADGLPKFGLNLRFPWQQDDAMDELTKDMARGERPSRSRDMFKRRKIGRNALCPCGSGKKYKKCCI